MFLYRGWYVHREKVILSLTSCMANFGLTATSLFEIWTPAWSSASTSRFHKATGTGWSFFLFLTERYSLFLLWAFFFFFLYQGSFSAFVFSMGKDFSINKELPRVNFVKCASRFLRRLCRPLRGISRCSAQQTFSVQWLLYSDDRFPNEFCFLFH